MSTDNWVHLDIAGVMTNKGDVAYMGKGMSGTNNTFYICPKVPIWFLFNYGSKSCLTILLCRMTYFWLFICFNVLSIIII